MSHADINAMYLIVLAYSVAQHECGHLCAGSAHLDRDMFSLMWGPTVAAVSVVLDHAEDMPTVRQALDGLLQAAKLGAYHHVDEVRCLALWLKHVVSVVSQLKHTWFNCVAGI